MKLPVKLYAKERTAAPLENAPPAALAALMVASVPRIAAPPPVSYVLARESPAVQVENAPPALLVALMPASVQKTARNADASAQKQAAALQASALIKTCAVVDPAHAQLIVDARNLPVVATVRSSSLLLQCSLPPLALLGSL